MARKGLTGQLNMFDFFKSMDDIPMGEVQMVSLMPEDEPEEEMPVEEPETIEEPPKVDVEEPKKPRVPRKKPQKVVEAVPQPEEVSEEEEKPPRPVTQVKNVTSSGNDKPAMCRQYVIDGKEVEIAYINYNKVRITREGQEPEVCEFESSKDAVDYYVQKMQELEPEEE